LVTPDIMIIDARVLISTASDHLPVIATIVKD
jgi:hypothetical protein